MFPFRRTRGSSAVPVRRGLEMGTAFRVRDDDVPVDQWTRWGTPETTVEPGFLQLKLTLRVGPSAGPGRLEGFGRGSVTSGPPDPSEDVPEGVVPADDEAAHPARERVEAVGVERLQALPGRRVRRCRLCRVAAPLVPAPVPLRPLREASPEAEAGADLELEISEARGSGCRRREEPSAGPRPAPGAEAGAVRAGQPVEQGAALLRVEGPRVSLLPLL